MSFRLSILTILFFGILHTATAQKDPVLFSVQNKPVHVSEFDYIYKKTNGEKADYSQKSLDEYLDLYIKFKLKVQRARDMQLDTIPALIKELSGYRRQLANSYLVDKEVTEKLVEEAYQRSQEEVDISHIMVKLSSNPQPADTLMAYKKIMKAKAALDSGQSFSMVAKEYSEDDNSKNNSGRLGYFGAIFRPGFYEMESAAYNLKVGKYYRPIRTAAGYHIIKLNSKRPARGEVEAAHILLRTEKGKSDKKQLATIDSLYQLLNNGGNFEKLASEFSQHQQTAKKGGYIGFVSTNSPVEESFKDQVFDLKSDKSFSKPFKSSVGWHIVSRISKKPVEAPEIAKRRLQTKIQNSAKGKAGKLSRQELAKQAMIVKIKKEANFKEKASVKKQMLANIDSTYTSHRWKKVLTNQDEVFSFGDKMKYTVADFNEFSKTASTRLKRNKNADPKLVAEAVYQEFIDDSALKYEEAQLENKYPEFKSLMREYEEGILLFEATKLQVWDKASTDSIGLATFHATVPDKYQWKERAVVDLYTLRSGNESKVKEIVTMLGSGKSPEDVLSTLNKEDQQILSVQEKEYEKGRDKNLDKISWKAGAVTAALKNDRTRSTSFMVIKSIKAPGVKTLDEARGYVIADYQDFLEKKWLAELKANYKVEKNDKVFKSLIKK